MHSCDVVTICVLFGFICKWIACGLSAFKARTTVRKIIEGHGCRVVIAMETQAKSGTLIGAIPPLMEKYLLQGQLWTFRLHAFEIVYINLATFGMKFGGALLDCALAAIGQPKLDANIRQKEKIAERCEGIL